MDILEMLHSKAGFTGTEIKIADYILEHSRQVSGMSANALAKSTFSSNASVIRMCRKMGLSGYREFQITLAARLSKQEAAGTHPNGYDAIFNDAAPEDVMNLLAGAVTAAAHNCLNSVSKESLFRAAVWMSRAKRLFVCGADCLNALALCQMMSRLGIASTVLDFPKEAPDGKQSDLEGSVALFTVCSGDALHAQKKDMVSLRKRGCRVIVLSTESACPEADMILSVPKVETIPLYAEAAYLQTAFLYLAACIYSLTGITKGVEIP